MQQCPSLGQGHYCTEVTQTMPDEDEGRWSRVNVYIDRDFAERLPDEIQKLRKKHGIRISTSGLVEIALRELLARRDLPDLLRKRGAKARRDSDTK